MKFKFRLQAVLEQRARRETLAQQTLAEARAALGRAEALLAEMRDVRQALLDELCRRRAGASEGAFDAFETRLYQDYMQVITQSIGEQEADVRALETSCAAHRLHLVGTARDRQALETVHDRHQLIHARKTQQREQAAMDELATTRFNHGDRQNERQNEKG